MIKARRRVYLSDFLFSFLVGTLYSFALSSAVISATVLEVPYRAMFIMCAASVLVWYIVFFNNYTFFTVFGLVALTGLTVYLYLRWHDFDVWWYAQGRVLIQDMFLFITNQLQYREEFSLYLGVVICLAVSLLMSVNTQVLFNFYIQSIMGLILLLAPMINKWGRSPIAVPLFVACFLICLTKEMNLLTIVRKGEWEQLNDIYALVFIPVAVLIFAASWMLPKPNVQHISLNSGSEPSRGLSDYLPFDIGSMPMAYTEEGGDMGGPVTLNEEFVMDVQSEERLYLSGSIRDTYDGSSWRRSSVATSSLTSDSYGEYITQEYPPALWDQLQYYMRFYGRTMKTVTINTGEKRVRTLYTPPFQHSLNLSDPDLRLEQDRYGSLHASRPLDSMTTYTQSYASWDYNSPYLAILLQSTAGQNPVGALSDEDLAPYLALPSSLPDRVGDLARQLTEGLDNNYDKLKAMEQYLTAFPYTLEPENVPADRDFVDYFLFSGQEGYCVYYASSLAVMGRTLGIPTRYVEGFVLPADRNDQGSFTVTNSQAHAWTEAYFPGFGWVQFEPTASNYAQLYDTPAPEPAPLPTPAEPNEQPDQPSAPDHPAEQSQAPDDLRQNGDEVPVGAVVLVLVVCGLAIVALILWRLYTRHKRKLDRVQHLPNGEAVVSYFSYLLWAAKRCGYPIRHNETALVYADRVGRQMDLKAAPLPQLAEIFSRASYSWNQITDQEKDLVKSGCLEMLERLQQRYVPKRFAKSKEGPTDLP